MIQINGTKIALISALVARVASGTEVRKQDFINNNVEHLHQLGNAIGATAINIYDLPVAGVKMRFVRLDFDEQSLEIEVIETPKPVVEDKPDPSPDPGTPGTTIATALAA